MKPLALFALLLLAALLSAACGDKPSPAPAAGGSAAPYKVVATVGMVADIVRNVAGDKATVRSMMGEGVDPHLYTPSRDDVQALIDADVVFYSGLLLEGRMTDTLEKISARRPVHAVCAQIDESYLMHKEGGHPDPHVWMDPSAWMKATEAVAANLAAFDPPNADLYRRNAEAYLAELKELDEYARKSFASIPEKQRLMVTAHDAFGYMGRAYGLEVRGIQGISTESEAGLQDINRLVELIVERRVPAVFVESSVSDKNVRALLEGAKSKGLSISIGGSLFSDAMGAGGTYEGTYVGMIDHNVTTIVRALGGEAPAGGMRGKLAPPREAARQ